MEKTYTIVLRPEPEGGFTVRVPALPEIVSYGEDEEEALAMAKDAIELCLIQPHGARARTFQTATRQRRCGRAFRERFRRGVNGRRGQTP